MKVHVEKFKQDQDEIMRKVREAETKLDEGDKETEETLDETNMKCHKISTSDLELCLQARPKANTLDSLQANPATE
jgi:hypothetical protein